MYEDGGNPGDQGQGQAGDLNDRGAGGASDGPQKTRWKLKVRGEEIVVDDESKIIELAQKGTAYEKAQAELKEEKRRHREEHANAMARIQPWVELDERAKADPVLQRRLQMAFQGEMLPEEKAGDADDPYMSEVNALKRQNQRLLAMVEGRVGKVQESVERLNRNENYRAEERVLRSKYGKWATDEAIDSARDFADRHGLDLVTAFKAVSFDDIPERVRQDVFEEFEIDPASITPARSEVPTIDGFGPLTPENRQKIYSDPDLYGRFKESLRAQRRRETGKLPLPR